MLEEVGSTPSDTTKVKDWGYWYDLSQASEEHPGGVPRPASETLPTMYDLPSEIVGEPGLPDTFHPDQAELLSQTCQPPTYPEGNFLVATDLNLYYDVHHHLWCKRPDWFLAVGVQPTTQQREMRWSYVIWQEGVVPLVVVELLSPCTEKEDLGKALRDASKPPTKWEVYERILRVPYYVVYDRYENHLRVFCLERNHYQLAQLSQDGRFWFEELGLGLGLWQGSYKGHEGLWLRWYGSEGWVPTLAERAEAEAQRAETAELRAEAEAQRAEAEAQRAEAEAQRAEAEAQRAKVAEQQAHRLAEYLRSLGLDPDQ